MPDGYIHICTRLKCSSAFYVNNTSIFPLQNLLPRLHRSRQNRALLLSKTHKKRERTSGKHWRRSCLPPAKSNGMFPLRGWAVRPSSCLCVCGVKVLLRSVLLFTVKSHSWCGVENKHLFLSFEICSALTGRWLVKDFLIGAKFTKQAFLTCELIRMKFAYLLLMWSVLGTGRLLLYRWTAGTTLHVLFQQTVGLAISHHLQPPLLVDAKQVRLPLAQPPTFPRRPKRPIRARWKNRTRRRMCRWLLFVRLDLLVYRLLESSLRKFPFLLRQVVWDDPTRREEMERLSKEKNGASASPKVR